MKDKVRQIAIILFIVGGLAVGWLVFTFIQNHVAGDFSVTDYQQYISNFPSDRIIGPVDDVRTAKKQAEIIWIETYGERIKKENWLYKVYYDKDSEIWMVTGLLPGIAKGGVPNILIRKEDGKVLAVWHGK
ncbi:MAG: NTF2 fold immunity protein [Saccharofermentanales bacterium]